VSLANRPRIYYRQPNQPEAHHSKSLAVRTFSGRLSHLWSNRVRQGPNVGCRYNHCVILGRARAHVAFPIPIDLRLEPQIAGLIQRQVEVIAAAATAQATVRS
jgi:hypothetical protein